MNEEQEILNMIFLDASVSGIDRGVEEEEFTKKANALYLKLHELLKKPH